MNGIGKGDRIGRETGLDPQAFLRFSRRLFYTLKIGVEWHILPTPPSQSDG